MGSTSTPTFPPKLMAVLLSLSSPSPSVGSGLLIADCEEKKAPTTLIPPPTESQSVILYETTGLRLRVTRADFSTMYRPDHELL
jgi:hypothetical protein